MARLLDARLQIWQPRDSGEKYTQNLQMHYSSGQSNAPLYPLMAANHHNYPLADAQETGRLSFQVTDSYWQTAGRLQVKEIANGDPHSLGQDTTLDVGWLDLHGFTVESIVCAGWRLLLVRINGTGLTFADVLERVDIRYPSPA